MQCTGLYLEIIETKIRANETTVKRFTFIAMIDKAIELLVVASSLAVIKPRPYLRFAKLNARSTYMDFLVFPLPVLYLRIEVVFV